jgi:hypothetical protein
MGKYIRSILVASLLLVCLTTVYCQPITLPAGQPPAAPQLTGSAGAAGTIQIDTNGDRIADTPAALFDLNNNELPDSLIIKLGNMTAPAGTATTTSATAPKGTSMLLPTTSGTPTVTLRLFGGGIDKTVTGLYVDTDNNNRDDLLFIPVGDKDLSKANGALLQVTVR